MALGSVTDTVNRADAVEVNCRTRLTRTLLLARDTLNKATPNARAHVRALLPLEGALLSRCAPKKTTPKTRTMARLQRINCGALGAAVQVEVNQASLVTTTSTSSRIVRRVRSPPPNPLVSTLLNRGSLIYTRRALRQALTMTTTTMPQRYANTPRHRLCQTNSLLQQFCNNEINVLIKSTYLQGRSDLPEQSSAVSSDDDDDDDASKASYSDADLSQPEPPPDESAWQARVKLVEVTTGVSRERWSTMNPTER